MQYNMKEGSGTDLCDALLVGAVKLARDEECCDPHDHKIQKHRDSDPTHIAEVVQNILGLQQNDHQLDAAGFKC